MKHNERRAAETPKRRVLLVDSHAVLREGLRRLIDQEPDLTVCGEAADPQQALERVGACRPDIVVTELFFKGVATYDLIRQIKAQHATLPVLVFSTHDRSVYHQPSQKAGASGFVVKEGSPTLLLSELRRILGAG